MNKKLKARGCYCSYSLYCPVAVLLLPLLSYVNAISAPGLHSVVVGVIGPSVISSNPSHATIIIILLMHHFNRLIHIRNTFSKSDQPFMRKKVVILGAGYAGIFAIANLCRAKIFDIILIDKNPYHLLLQQISYVVSGEKDPGAGE
jgi:threonine dehydrogenase-like Zn-dependent dehydrogenase